MTGSWASFSLHALNYETPPSYHDFPRARHLMCSTECLLKRSAASETLHISAESLMVLGIMGPRDLCNRFKLVDSSI